MMKGTGNIKGLRDIKGFRNSSTRPGQIPKRDRVLHLYQLNVEKDSLIKKLEQVKRQGVQIEKRLSEITETIRREISRFEEFQNKEQEESGMPEKDVNASDFQDQQGDTVPHEHETTGQAELAPQYSSKLQELQQQIQTAQQQLEATRVQLREAKELESQLQIAKQKLQDIQDELQTAQAELSETHSRIEQY